MTWLHRAAEVLKPAIIVAGAGAGELDLTSGLHRKLNSRRFVLRPYLKSLQPQKWVQPVVAIAPRGKGGLRQIAERPGLRGRGACIQTPSCSQGLSFLSSALLV